MSAIATPIPSAEPVSQRRALLSADVTEEYLRSATPGQGSITYEDGYDTKRHMVEISFSQWLYKTLGGDIKLLNESTVEGEKRADYLWRGHLWDLKNVSSEQAANTAIKRGLLQIRDNPGGIILNYEDMEVNPAVLSDVIHKRMQWLRDGTYADIMIVLKHGNLKVLRYYRER